MRSSPLSICESSGSCQKYLLLAFAEAQRKDPERLRRNNFSAQSSRAAINITMLLFSLIPRPCRIGEEVYSLLHDLGMRLASDSPILQTLAQIFVNMVPGKLASFPHFPGYVRG